MVRIPQNLPGTVERLIIENSGLQRVRVVGLRKYGSTLKDL